MANTIDVERQNAVERAAAVHRLRHARAEAIQRGDLAQLLPPGTHSGVVRLLERYLALDITQRAALEAAMAQPEDS